MARAYKKKKEEEINDRKENESGPRMDVEIAQEARSACEKWGGYFKVNFDLYHMMHTFVLGQQWTDDEQDEMIKTYKKTPLTANHLGTMSNALLGEQQQNTPQLQVIPMENCDFETARLREVITKDILFNGKSTVVYQKAAAQAAIGGFGAYIIGTEYNHTRSFDLNIVHYWIKDVTRCYWDISAEEVNKIDSMVSGYHTRMSREKFRTLYGEELEQKISKAGRTMQSKGEISLMTQPDDHEDSFNWYDDEGISIIHHYKRRCVDEKLYKLSNSRTVNQEELDEIIDKSRQKMIAIKSQFPEEGMVEDDGIIMLWDGNTPVKIVNSKVEKVYKVKHYMIAGDYILEENDFPSEHSPVIFVDNHSYYDKSGKQLCRSFFGDALDSQRYINYLRTTSAHILKCSRYDQWVLSRKNVQSQETQNMWRNPQNAVGALIYDESPNGDKPFQPSVPELSASLFQQYQLAVDDLYRTTGMYPARLGNAGDEASGKATRERTKQGSYPTFVFFNSINRAIEAGGTVVNEMIPHVYDSERVLTLMMPDVGMKTITINKQSDDYGEVIENDIRKGTYEVKLLPGPSYEGQKQEALNALQQVLQIDPTLLKLVIDLYAENLPLANNIEIKNRLKTLVPPEIVEAGKTGEMPQQAGPSPEEQQLQLQAQQVQMDAQYKAKQLEIKEQEIELKKQEILLEAQMKMQELETERLEAAAEIKEAELRFVAENNRTSTNHQIANTESLIKLLTHHTNNNDMRGFR